MSFRDSIVAGINLVRNAIRSPNYVTGVSGWTINRDGTAEFNSIVARGQIIASSFSTGTTGSRILIADGGGFAFIDFWSNDPQEIGPGSVSNSPQNTGTTQASTMTMFSSNDGHGQVGFSVVAPDPLGVDAGGSFFFARSGSFPPAATDISAIRNNAKIKLALTDVGLDSATLTAANPPFQIGATTGSNTAYDNDVIQTRNAGSAATMFLQAFGGGIDIASTAGSVSIIGNGANSIVALGGVSSETQIANKITAPQMDGARINDATARTTASLTYAVPAGSTCNLTIPTPSSKQLLVSVFSNVFNTGANSTFVGYEIRENNAAGAVLQSGNDGLAGLLIGTLLQTIGRTVITATAALGTTAPKLYIQLVGRVSAGTGSFANSSLSVVPML